MDSGSTSHVIRDRSAFWTYDEDQRPNVGTVCHGNLRTQARGDCVALVQSQKGPTRVRLKGCLHAPNARLDLISVGKLLRNGLHCVFTPGEFVILDPRSTSSSRLECRGPIHGDLGYLPLTFLPPDTPQADSPIVREVESPEASPPHELTAFVKPVVTRDLWHARMGHASPKAITSLAANSTGMTLTGPPFSMCESCIKGKHTRAPHPESVSRAKVPLALIHIDICGPMPVQTPHGKLLFIALLDDNTHALDVHLLASRDQALEAFVITHHKWERMFDRKIQTIRMDNAGELNSREFTEHLTKHGIRKQLSAPYAHQQNGRAERLMRTMQGRMRSMMDAVGAPKNLWGEATLTCAYLFWRTPTTTLPDGKTPFEMVHGTPPDLSNLRVWGSKCFARVPTELQTKLGTRSRECVFMGYPDGVKGWRVRDVSTGTFFNSRDVIFAESLTSMGDDNDTPTNRRDAHNTSDTTQNATAIAPQVTDQALPQAATPTPLREHPARNRQPSRLGIQYEKDREAQRIDSERRWAIWHASRVKNHQPDRDQAVPTHVYNDDHANLMYEESVNLSIRSDIRRNPLDPSYDLTIPPATYSESQARPDAGIWQACVDKELNTLKSMGVYELARLPANRRAIGNRWVFEFKITD